MHESERQGYPEPADPVARIAAKVIDVLIAAVLARMLPAWGGVPLGMLLGLAYLLLADSLDGGRSGGKRLLSLRVINPKTGQLATAKQSFLRNAHLALLYALMFLPLLGPILVIVLGAFIFAVELYAIFQDRHGLRMGDLFADTIVVGQAWISLKEPKVATPAST